MSSLFDNLSEELFQVLKGSGKTLTLYGPDGNKTYEPREARRVFATPDNIMISVVEAGIDSEVKLYLSQSTDVRDVSRLINTLRQISTRYNVLFNVRKYGKELSPKDFAYQAQIGEAAMWGSTRTSYQKFGPTRLMIRHCQPVREGVMGARGRNILSMFVETRDGERFRFPVNHLSGGRAFAQHINQGGKPHDELGTSISSLALESQRLADVNRYIRFSRGLLDEEAVELRNPIRNRIGEIRGVLTTLAGPRGYGRVAEHDSLTRSPVLLESQDLEDMRGHLSHVLKIDDNHALAESLAPVAVLMMGDKMNKINEVFQGVLSLDESVVDALVEALQDEYGHEESSYARLRGGIGFMESEALEDARDYLSITEALNEADDEADNEAAPKADVSQNPIMKYAQKWSTDRYSASGEESAMDKEQVKGITDLAHGIADIVGGHITIPDYPQVAPNFSRTDTTVRDRFYLDLYVGQHKLSNVATLNYVSNIIDKIAENKKLDGVEKVVSLKLIQALEDDLHGGEEVDESYYDMSIDPPHGERDDAKYERALEDIVDQFDVEDFVRDIYPYILDGDDKDEALDAKYVMTNLDGHVALEMDSMDFRASKGNFEPEAKELFPRVREFCEDRGYHFDNVVKEFAESPEEPGHHGFAAGDHVASDMGPGQIISVEGDIAHVEFLNGGTKSLHVDDLDKVEGLGNVAEERELSEWFANFDPKAILEFASPKDPYDQGVMAGKMGKSAEDCPFNPEGQEGQAWLRGLHGMSHPFANDIDEDRVDELSHDRKADYFNKAARDRGRAERGGDDDRLARRDRGLSMAFKKMREEAELDESIGNLNLDVIFDNLKAKAQEIIQKPSKFGLENPDEVFDDQNEAEEEFFQGLQNILISQLENAIYDIRHNAEGVSEDDDTLGGDQGEDLIDDTRVHEVGHMDEAAEEELATLLKNARFRM